MLKYETVKNLDDEFIIHTYNRMPGLFVQGAGCSLWDNRGNEYLDLLAGIAVCLLGHCHPAVVSAITRQAQQSIHTSNILLTAPQAFLAEKLCQISGMDRVFFCTDGTTANEGALKMAKKHGNRKRPDGDYEIITLQHSFHGRSLGSLSATGQRKYQRPFEPLIPGFIHIAPNDIVALREVFSHKTAAINLEPILGEGGPLELTPEFLKEAESLCREHDALFIADEVQCGMGRTGKWFGFQHHALKPDIVCLAKGLGGGVPIGAILARGAAASLLEPGDHGSTFGGNPLACAVGLAVIETIESQKIMENVNAVGDYLKQCLEEMPAVVEVRGKGLILGAVLEKPDAKSIVRECFDRKLILNATDDSTIRIVPPLILTLEQAEKAMGILAETLGVAKPTVIPVRPKSHAAEPLHDVLAIDDLSVDQLEEILSLATDSKQRRKRAPAPILPIENRSVALVFEKPSLRTRVSFETAIRELGGHPIYLSKNDIGMGTRESIRDVATNLARWNSMIVARLYWHRDLEKLAAESDVPVINALTEWEHPCQALADLQTIREEFGDEKVKITYVGDGNNVARSLAKAATALGYPFTLCGPENFGLEDSLGVHQTPNLEEGLSGSKVVYTDVWVSMGDEHEQDHRLKVFDRYQVNARVMGMADKDSIFLHCLPARRGFEVTDDVIDGPQSRVVDQAENRLHAQKALLQRVLGL